MIKYFCDRCGKEVTHSGALHEVKVAITKSTRDPTLFESKPANVCSECEHLHTKILETLVDARFALTERYWNNTAFNCGDYNAQLMIVETPHTISILRPKIGDKVYTIKGPGVVIGTECKFMNDTPDNYIYTVCLDSGIYEFTEMQVWQLSYGENQNDT